MIDSDEPWRGTGRCRLKEGRGESRSRQGVWSQSKPRRYRSPNTAKCEGLLIFVSCNGNVPTQEEDDEGQMDPAPYTGSACGLCECSPCNLSVGCGRQEICTAGGQGESLRRPKQQLLRRSHFVQGSCGWKSRWRDRARNLLSGRGDPRHAHYCSHFCPGLRQGQPGC